MYCSISGRLMEFDTSSEPELLDINKDDRSDQISMASATSSLYPKYCTAVYDYKVCSKLLLMFNLSNTREIFLSTG